MVVVGLTGASLSLDCVSSDADLEASQGANVSRRHQLVRALIAEGEREYTHSGHQSQKGRENIPKVGTNWYGENPPPEPLRSLRNRR
eukprot:1195903-Prorocentrum_minimum.AAC.3